MTGKVYLVGAGPGDPELLTLKAVRVLKQADVVLHDDLVGPKILDFAPAHAQIRNVGKRCGTKNISQEEINFLMVTLAASGLQVVRLKGGDPLIFGRIGEEIAALHKANIEFEIVPGITAALGAASTAQIPLTHRQSSHALVFLAGHFATADDPTNWHALASLEATIVIYMPGHNYSEIARKLRGAGLPDGTPCAIISRATTSDEQVFSTKVENLGDAPRLPAPTLLVIGKVVRHAEDRFSPEELAAWNCWNSSEPSLAMHAASELSRSSSAGLGDEEQGV
ncbi:MAG TPA: uroporphyrinogen-III C-methyltransferase [Terriglobales bacterium]|jgi:uroporphyrin-III C-methyltransferase|nr:uroporphyrinogen-III C-methyltransferase [Terriglobales bacterium]